MNVGGGWGYVNLFRLWLWLCEAIREMLLVFQETLLILLIKSLLKCDNSIVIMAFLSRILFFERDILKYLSVNC